MSDTKKDERNEPVKLFTRIVGAQHLVEGGERYKPGDKIELTPGRAKALGGLVKTK